MFSKLKNDLPASLVVFLVALPLCLGVALETVFDLGLGDIFSIRIAGNILNQDILGSMEFAVHSGVKLVMVLGHTKCGAVVGACNHVSMGNLTPLLDKIQPAILKETSISEDRTGKNLDFVNKVAELNVQLIIEQIRLHSPIIAQAEKEEKIKILGGFYDIELGVVKFYE